MTPSDNPPDLIRRNVRLLHDTLTEAIRYLDGDEASALIDRARQAARGWSDEPLDHLFVDMSDAELAYLARAFACGSTLANIGEDTALRMRGAELESGGRSTASDVQTLPRALAALKAAGEAMPDLSKLNVVPVLTAHPSEMRRHSLVDRETEIARLMALAASAMPGAVDRRLEADIFREVALLWKTRQHRPEKITVADEISNALDIVGRAILPALIELYESWGVRLAEQGLGEEGELPPMLKLGSWLGGDRDGHPGVDAETLRIALKSQARLLLDYYDRELKSLWNDLAISSDYITVSDAVRALAEEGAQADPSVHRRDEPYRLAIEAIHRRLNVTLCRLADGGPSEGSYNGPGDFVGDLRAVAQSLEAFGGDRLIGGRLKSLMQTASALGFHLLSIDLRQNADVHERMVAELFKNADGLDYLALDEDGRVALLVSELSHQRPLRSPFTTYSDETMRELGTLEAAAQAVGMYGPGALGSYIISKSASLSDILEPLVLLKQVGLVWGAAEPHAAVRIAPLFETIDDLTRGPQILKGWLSLPMARTLLGPCRVQEVMVGYSDSNKDGGYVASRRGVAQAASAMARVCDQMGVGLQLFHGRGGSVGRGGGPAAEAVLAQPAGTVQGRMRLTEQGEMIYRRYGDQATARRNLDALTAAVVTASFAPRKALADKALEARFDDLARASFAAYRALVYDTPGFEDFFWSATPIAEIVQLNIGSRPASRTPSRKIEDLRAIPWVFSWSQARFMLPGWYGFAGGVERAGLSAAEVADLAARHEPFAVLLSNMELALAQSDMALAASYAALAPDPAAAQAIMDQVRREHEAAIALALSARGGTRLLDNNPVMAHSVELARQIISPMNHLQLELLSRRRAGANDETVRLGLQLTVGGIAAGLRNTG
jgi:phosphoenolpyruvate carboxylase